MSLLAGHHLIRLIPSYGPTGVLIGKTFILQTYRSQVEEELTMEKVRKFEYVKTMNSCRGTDHFFKVATKIYSPI